MPAARTSTGTPLDRRASQPHRSYQWLAGTGKLTIARHLADHLGARLADNHTLINPAEALFTRGTPLYWSLRATIRTAVLDHVRQADAGQSFLFTDALSDDAFDSRAFEDYVALASERSARFVAVVLDCSIEENLKRLTRAGRSKVHKLTDPQVLIDLRGRHALLKGNATSSSSSTSPISRR